MPGENHNERRTRGRNRRDLSPGRGPACPRAWRVAVGLDLPLRLEIAVLQERVPAAPCRAWTRKAWRPARRGLGRPEHSHSRQDQPTSTQSRILCMDSRPSRRFNSSPSGSRDASNVSHALFYRRRSRFRKWSTANSSEHASTMAKCARNSRADERMLNLHACLRWLEWANRLTSENSGITGEG